MNLTLWTLALLALAAAIYFGRGRLGYFKDRKERNEREARSRESRAEAERQEIFELMRKLDPSVSGGAAPATATSDRRRFDRGPQGTPERRAARSPHDHGAGVPDARSPSGRS